MTKADARKLPPELWQPIVEHASNYARTRGTPAAPAHYAKLRGALRWAAQFAAIEDEPREETGCAEAQPMERAA